MTITGVDDPRSAAPSEELSDAPVDAGPIEPMVTLDDPRHLGADWTRWVGLTVAILCGIGVFAALGPGNILMDTTPTGGDMGAHVWGPEYLKTELLPNFRLSGWTPDWYAGFPAYTFYMVVPSLFMVWLDMGLPLFLGVPLAIAVLVGAAFLQRRFRTNLARTVLWCAAVFAAVAMVDVSYNVAFKLVSVSGLVTLPVAAWALGRAAKVPFPGPPLLAIGATFFLFEGGYSILGGNILSTMAGEFAFSISLTFALLYLAVLVRGSRRGRDRALGAVLFAAVITTHLIPAIFVAVATVVLAFVRREDRTPWWDGSRLGRWIGVEHVVLVVVVLWLVPAGFPVVATFVALAMLGGVDSRVWRWAIVTLPVGGLLACFWFVPFYLNSPFLNDMGWEKYTNYAQYLWPQPEQFDMAYRNFWFALAGAGMLLSLMHRVRLGWFLTLTMVAFGWAFVFLPQYRLWNARLLPFYYLCLYLLAGLAVALIIRALAVVVGDWSRDREEPAYVSVVALVLVGLASLVYIGGAVKVLQPGEEVTVTNSDGSTTPGYRWGFDVGNRFLGFTFTEFSNASGWANYNYLGLQGSDGQGSGKAWPEYSAVIDMMREVGEEHGCGRAMWEYESNLSRFGTPMALMLMPYFTDGCIGSMEGLYFEASSTTPFHFINQSELSPSPSRAQRDLPYPDFDLDAGVRHLQLMGVPYYMASTDQAITAARANPDLTELDSTGPFTLADGTTREWVVFEVADAEPVVSLSNLPAVLTPEDDHIDGWVYGDRPEPTDAQPNPPKATGPAIAWYLDPSRWDVHLATSGPADWPRVTREEAADPPVVPVDPVEVSDVETTNDSISFTVSEPGTPVLVRTSYFPNWSVSGAEGPFRVSPNFMAVVPTDTEVTLSYGYTWIDGLGWFLTILGIALVIPLARADQRRREGEEHLFGEDMPSGDVAG